MTTTKKSLPSIQVKQLESLGVQWKSNAEIAWDKRYEAVKQYYDEHGTIEIPGNVVLSDGRNISPWFGVQRKYRKEGKLNKRQIALLDALGFAWEFGDPWEIGFAHAEQFYRENGHLLVSHTYVSSDGYTLGRWIANNRSNYMNPKKYHYITDEQAKRLESIKMIWSSKQTK